MNGLLVELVKTLPSQGKDHRFDPCMGHHMRNEVIDMYKGLYDSFKHWFRGGQVYFYSDPHFSDEEMVHVRKNYISDEEQVKKINSKIGKNDTIVILGDIGNIDYVRQLRGYKVLIMGNHDSGASNYIRRVTEELCNAAEKDQIMSTMCAENPGAHVYAYSEVIFEDAEPIWHVCCDNKLFDEVYEGALIISDKMIISHEPAPYPFAFNIHGHDHNRQVSKLNNDMSVCAEHIDYTPVCLKEIINSGKLKHILDIHRVTIDKATIKSKRKEKR